MQFEISDLKSLGISLTAALLFYLGSRILGFYYPKIRNFYYLIRGYLTVVAALVFFAYMFWAYINFSPLRVHAAIIILLVMGVLVFRSYPSQIGETLYIENIDPHAISKVFKVNKLRYHSSYEKLDLSWETFGNGVEELKKIIETYSSAIYPDVCIGINEAGLVMATFIAGSLGRKRLGYLKTGGRKQDGSPIVLKDESFLPSGENIHTIALFDFEIKSGASIKIIKRELLRQYEEARIFYVVMGASTSKRNLDITSVKDISATVADDDKPNIFRFVMHNVGIEPPMGLR